jgi:hypothetical protein
MVVDTRKNKVFINELDVIEAIVNGDQTPESINKMFDMADMLCEELRAAGKPVVTLDSLLLMGNVSVEGRKVVVERLKSMPYDRFAFLSKDRVVRLGANLILQATGQGGKVKFFDDYDQAINWLTELK